MTNDTQIADEALTAIKNIVRRAIMTLVTLKDPDRKYQYRSTAWLLPVVNAAQESYGYARYGFEPTPHDISQMEVIAGWLSWLKRTEGEFAVRRLIRWTIGVPTWRIGVREKCSERTVRNRIDRSMAAIIRKFADVNVTVEVTEERLPGALRNGNSLYPMPLYDLVFEKPAGPHGGEAILRKVYIYDKGFMIGGSRLRDGKEKANRFGAAA